MPVIIDIDPISAIPSPELLEQAIKTTGAKAAMLVAPYGIRPDFSRHAEICARHGARLIIDNAAGLGVSRASQGYPLPHVDEVFSLHATKPFGIGEGGVIFTHHSNANSLRSALNFGLITHSAFGSDLRPYWGINGKLTEVAAAIGLAVAETMNSRVLARQQMAQEWIETLADLQICLFCDQPESAVWQVFPVIIPDEAMLVRFVAAMAQKGIELRRYYFPSLGACAGMQSVGACDNAQNLASRAVVLPVRSFMVKDDRKHLMQTTRECLLSVTG